jgi:hypothetical protein
MAFTTLKIVVLTPMPMAKQATAMSANIRLRANVLKAYRTS